MKKGIINLLVASPTSAFHGLFTRWTSAISGFREHSIGRLSTVISYYTRCEAVKKKKKKKSKLARPACVNDALMKCWTAVKVLRWVVACSRSLLHERTAKVSSSKSDTLLSCTPPYKSILLPPRFTYL